jgi:biopolymer transport protein ExbD
MGVATSTGKRRRRRLVAAINITPLTDVALVLLVVFMITATFLGSEANVNVDLPGAASATAREDVGGILAVARSDGGFVIDGQEIPRKLLVSAFREKAKVGGHKQVVIRGDRSCRYEDVFAMMDAARLAGLTDIALATQPQPSVPSEDGAPSP